MNKPEIEEVLHAAGELALLIEEALEKFGDKKDAPPDPQTGRSSAMT